MSNGTARYFIIALMALLLADWTQPLLLQACTLSPTMVGGRAACGMTSSDMLPGSAASGDAMPACCAVAPLGHAAASHGAAGHNGHQPDQAADAGGASCSMQACPSFVPPVLAANLPVISLSFAAEYVVVPHDAPLPASPVCGLFRPPRTSATIWG